MQYEARPTNHDILWQVWRRDDGMRHFASFAGPDAEPLARDYAAWKNAAEEPERPPSSIDVDRLIAAAGHPPERPASDPPTGDWRMWIAEQIAEFEREIAVLRARAAELERAEAAAKANPTMPQFKHDNADDRFIGRADVPDGGDAPGDRYGIDVYYRAEGGMAVARYGHGWADCNAFGVDQYEKAFRQGSHLPFHPSIHFAIAMCLPYHKAGA